jgi:hypothetical protein
MSLEGLFGKEAPNDGLGLDDPFFVIVLCLGCGRSRRLIRSSSSSSFFAAASLGLLFELLVFALDGLDL